MTECKNNTECCSKVGFLWFFIIALAIVVGVNFKTTLEVKNRKPIVDTINKTVYHEHTRVIEKTPKSITKKIKDLELLYSTILNRVDREKLLCVKGRAEDTKFVVTELKEMEKKLMKCTNDCQYQSVLKSYDKLWKESIKKLQKQIDDLRNRKEKKDETKVPPRCTGQHCYR